MRFILMFVLLLLSSFGISAQNAKADPASEPGIPILQPDQAHVEAASRGGVNVFKILPRGMFEFDENELKLRGGGAYYSFTKKSHSYNDIPQLGLEKGRLSVSFYGANYGFIKDLGNQDLTTVNETQKEVVFLAGYTPPIYEVDVRKEQRKSQDYLVDGINYKRDVEAVGGHTYVLRAIGFRESDTLVAFSIQRIYDDGSMVIFWKPIKEFTVPKLLAMPDAELKARVDEILKDPRYSDIACDVFDNRITLRGKVARDDYVGLMSAVQKENKGGIVNQVTSK